MKIYQGPVYIVEDILHLEIVMGAVYTKEDELKKEKNLQAIWRSTVS